MLSEYDTYLASTSIYYDLIRCWHGFDCCKYPLPISVSPRHDKSAFTTILNSYNKHACYCLHSFNYNANNSLNTMFLLQQDCIFPKDFSSRKFSLKVKLFDLSRPIEMLLLHHYGSIDYFQFYPSPKFNTGYDILSPDDLSWFSITLSGNSCLRHVIQKSFPLLPQLCSSFLCCCIYCLMKHSKSMNLIPHQHHCIPLQSSFFHQCACGRPSLSHSCNAIGMTHELKILQFYLCSCYYYLSSIESSHECTLLTKKVLDPHVERKLVDAINFLNILYQTYLNNKIQRVFLDL